MSFNVKRVLQSSLVAAESSICMMMWNSGKYFATKSREQLVAFSNTTMRCGANPLQRLVSGKKRPILFFAMSTSSIAVRFRINTFLTTIRFWVDSSYLVLCVYYCISWSYKKRNCEIFLIFKYQMKKLRRSNACTWRSKQTLTKLL